MLSHSLKSQDISNLCVTLPRLPKDLDVLLIRKPSARDPSTYRDFWVRKAKVLQFLHFLKANNPFYAHIDICQPVDIESLTFRLMETFWTSNLLLNLNNVMPLPTHTTVLMKHLRIPVNYLCATDAKNMVPSIVNGQGLEKPMGFAQGFPGVRVRVWHPKPLPNPYPCSRVTGLPVAARHTSRVGRSRSAAHLTWDKALDKADVWSELYA